MSRPEDVKLKGQVYAAGLLTTTEFDRASPGEVAAASNGIGPERWARLFRKAVSVLLRHFSLAAVVHDWEYERENDGTRERWHEANSRFEENCRREAMHEISRWRFLRRSMALGAVPALFAAVESEEGWQSWLEAFARKSQQP